MHAYDTDTYDCDCIVCVWACEASLRHWINWHKFHSPQTQLTRWPILPFRLSVGDMIYDDLGEHFMDICKHNCVAGIWVDSILNLKITHWDLRYNAQDPFDLMVKLFEWQPKELCKMQHWEKCIKITWAFHNLCSKKSSICRQYIFLTILNILMHLNMSSAKWWRFCLGHISVIIFCISSEIR